MQHQVNKTIREPRTCHFCNDDETIMHLFQCQSRQHWRKTFSDHLHQHLLQLNIPLAQVQHIESYIITRISPAEQHHHFSSIVFFAGLLPRSWQHNISQLSKDCDIAQHDTKIWARKLSGWLTQQGFDLWERRNTQINEQNNKTSTNHTVLNDKITQLYTLQPDINYYDRNLFQMALEDRLKMTERQKRQWINITEPTIHRCIADHQQNMKHGQQDIRKYFQSSRTEE